MPQEENGGQAQALGLGRQQAGVGLPRTPGSRCWVPGCLVARVCQPVNLVLLPCAAVELN